MASQVYAKGNAHLLTFDGWLAKWKADEGDPLTSYFDLMHPIKEGPTMEINKTLTDAGYDLIEDFTPVRWVNGLGEERWQPRHRDMFCWVGPRDPALWEDEWDSDAEGRKPALLPTYEDAKGAGMSRAIDALREGWVPADG